jgi:ATP-dependent helicase HrpA
VSTPVAVRELRERLGSLTLRDERRLARRLDGLQAPRDAARRATQLARIAADVEAAEQRVALRRAAVPRVSYPPDLPVSQRRDDLLAALRDSQVVVVAGETGSGKTTQLPKLCLELGRGVRGTIGHTQPRRIAARAVAERVAEEVGSSLGEVVGYKVRFHDQVSDTTLVKLMTDGILLAEMQDDRLLTQYDTIILDEAHERSLNIDFLLGYLTQLLPRRPDLKLVITSATIETERFSAHFGGAPVVEVSGRTYPVEVRYRPLVEETDDGDDEVVRDQVQAVVEAVDELGREGPGDVLVFLSGEREIRDTADALQGRLPAGTEVLPLFGRLTAAEQHRVFAAHTGRRVVLATNVAETSLTVPGIRYVVDPGTARISRYSQRTKVQRLPIEPISQASARQRAGRCGRVAEGVCIRLYEEQDLLARPEFTDPEILRTHLASVLLQMAALGLGAVEDFPFVDPPDRRSIRDGVQLLAELGALDGDRLTPLGRQLARLPLDPRLGRMVLEADRLGCVRDVLVIVAALSIQDVRERPQDKQQQAAELHRRFADETSDFLAHLNLWHYLQEQQRALSSSAFRRLCKRELLSYLRIREWQDLHTQLRRTIKGLELSLDGSATDPDRVHQALLAGLLSHVGLRDPDKREYAGARGTRFAVVPGSSLSRKQPRFVMAAELVETNRLWARVVARISPEWAEQVGAHLVKRSYSEPHWEQDMAAVMAFEKVTLYGVPLVARRRVSYGRVDPEVSRDLFLRHALVQGEWSTSHAFFARNRELLEEVEELEHRARRRDLVVGDDELYAFYDARVPADVVSGRHFDSWWKKARQTDPDLLTFRLPDLVQGEQAALSALEHPDVWVQDDLRLPLSYAFEPGSEADGVTVSVPLAVLNRLRPDDFCWQVPGLRTELVTALLRSLPKPLRVRCVPAPDVARDVLAQLHPREQPLLDALERELLRQRGADVRREDWQLAKVPAHLRMSFRVEDERGRTLGQSRDLEELQRRLAPQLQTALSRAGAQVERRGLRAWEIGTLPRTVARGAVQGFPALVDEGDSVAVRVLATAGEQELAMWQGTRRLLQLSVPSPVKQVSSQLSNAQKLSLSRNPHGSVPALVDDCSACAVDGLLRAAGGPVWDEEGFARVREAVRADLHDALLEVLRTVEQVLAAWHRVTAALAAERRPALAASVADMRAQVDELVHPGFVAATGRDRLPDLLRYLQAVERRLDKLPLDPARDAGAMRRVAEVRSEYDALRAKVPDSPALRELRWMLEELRVSLFAQPMRTRYPVSEKRIWKAMDALLG